jgi:RsiW-degrading membrane proteinase PrsW (M82 family)
MTASTIFFAFTGGILPALLWLWFWLREDRKSPEPRALIINTFIAGMIAVLVAFLLERGVALFLSATATSTLVIWALIEEVLKFGAAYLTGLRLKDNDEPVDAMIYMITAALGFSALENAFFLLTPLGEGSFAGFLITGNLRFIGSTLLHVIASGTVGVFVAYGFFEGEKRKKLLLGLGLILALVLHTFFNFFILQGNNNLFSIFGFVWVGVVLLILFFERVKHIEKSRITNISEPTQ